MRTLLALIDPGTKNRFAASLGLSMLAGASGTALLGLSGWFLTAAALAGLAGTGLVFNHLYPSAGVRGFAFGRVFTRYTEQLVGHDATLRFSRRLRSSLFAAEARGERGFAPIPSDRLSVLIDDVETVEAGFLRIVIPTAAVAASVLVAVGFASAASPALGVATLVAAVASGFVLPRWASRRARQASERLAAQGEGVRGAVARLVDNAVELDIYGALAEESDRLADELSSHQSALDAIERPFRRLAAVNTLIGGVLVLALLSSVGGESRLALAAGGALAILAAFDGLGAMTKVFDAVPRASASAARISATLSTGDAVPQPEPETALPLDGVLPITADALRVRPAAKGPVIGPVSFTIAPGTVTLVTGESGSGKTTLLEALLRLHPLADGALRYRGTCWTRVRTPSVLAHMAVSPQFEAFLPGTIRDQLRLADPDADDDACWAALRTAGLDRVVGKRDGGLDHVLREGQADLSGGEMRRLNLARALMTEAEVLVLDEPFAGLEPGLVRSIAARLAAWAAEGRRALIIAQHEAIVEDWGGLSVQSIALSETTSSPLPGEDERCADDMREEHA